MYVDHAFSISDEDIMMGTSYTVNNKPPIKEIALAVSLLVCGVLGIVIGSLMAYNHVGGDTAHGNNKKKAIFFSILKKKNVNFQIWEHWLQLGSWGIRNCCWSLKLFGSMWYFEKGKVFGLFLFDFFYPFCWFWFFFEWLIGIFFAVLGFILFIPGFYYTRIAYYAYKGYKGFSFSNIPPV